jgi:hypothetical protein
MLETILLLAILVVLIGILAAVKRGFDETIKGLQSIFNQINEARRGSGASDR